MFIDFSKGAIRSFVICQGLCYLASDKKLYKSQLELMGRLVVLLKHITVSTALEARKTLLLEHRDRGQFQRHSAEAWDGLWPSLMSHWPFPPSWSSLRENLSLISRFSHLICHGRILTLCHTLIIKSESEHSIYLGHLPKIGLKIRNRSNIQLCLKMRSRLQIYNVRYKKDEQNFIVIKHLNSNT